MTRPIDLLRQGRKEELWQMCCGFIHLSREQFMAIQKELRIGPEGNAWRYARDCGGIP